MPVFRLLACLLLFASSSYSAELRLLAGNQVLKGELVAIDDKNIVFKSEDGLETRPLAGVLQLELQPAPALSTNYVQVELTDGSVLNCKPEGITFDGKQVQLTMLPAVSVRVPITALSFILKDAQDPKLRDDPDWKLLLKNKKSQDLLVRWFQNRLNGIDGTFADGKGPAINFVPDGRNQGIPVDLNNKTVQGCIFVNKPDVSAPPTLCKLYDMSQNVLLVSKLELKEGGSFFQVTTVAGAKIEYALDQVARLDYSRGKLTYLSDLEPMVLQEPGEDVIERYRRDQNADGNPLQVGGQRFAKGLFVPAPTVLVYKINGDYNEFTAAIGVDETVPGNSHVRLVVSGDGKELFAGEFKRSDKRRDLKLIIKDVQELKIAVDSVELLKFGSHLNLVDAKFTK